MAIGRYEKQRIDANVQTEKLGGAADEAAAKGFAGVAQAQKGLAAQHGQRARQEVASFAERLNDFTRRTGVAMESHARVTATESAIKDTATRRKEILDIQEKYAGNPDVMAQKISEVETATAKDNFSLYGKIYRDQVNTSYATQTEIDAVNATAMAERTANGNPEVFKDVYNSYMSERMQGAPNDISKLATEKAFEKYGIRKYNNMYTSLAKANATALDKKVKLNITGLQGLIKDASSRGDTTSAKAYQGQLAALVNGRYELGKMDIHERDWNIRESQTISETANFMRSVNAEVNQGRGWGLISKIQNPDHPYGKEFSALGYEAQQNVLSEAKSAIDTYRSNEYAKEEHENKKVKVHQETNLRGLKEEVSESGIELSEEEIKKLEGKGAIDEKGAKEIREYQTTKTDQDVLTAFSDGSVLVDMTADEIHDLPNISPKDKQKLLKQRESAIKDPNFNWIKNDMGKRAFTFLKQDYNMPKDNVAIMMATISKEKPPNQRAYEKAYRDLILAVEQYPVSERAGKVMSEYKKLNSQAWDKKQEAKQVAKDVKVQRATSKVMAHINKSKEGNVYKAVNFIKEGLIEPLSVEEAATELYEQSKITKPEMETIITNASAGGLNTPEKKETPKPIVPAKLEEPRINKYKAYVPKPDSHEHETRSAEWGHQPKITGKNVDIARVRVKIKKAAYPIMNKYGLTIKDGYRAKRGGGAKKSQHLHGNALDIQGWGKMPIVKRQEIIQELKAAGFNGFGIGPTTLHVDMRGKPASWSYYGGSATGKGGKMPSWAAEAIRS